MPRLGFKLASASTGATRRLSSMLSLAGSSGTTTKLAFVLVSASCMSPEVAFTLDSAGFFALTSRLASVSFALAAKIGATAVGFSLSGDSTAASARGSSGLASCSTLPVASPCVIVSWPNKELLAERARELNAVECSARSARLARSSGRRGLGGQLSGCSPVPARPADAVLREGL